MKQSKQPLISVVMAVYKPNRAFFEQQVESLASQTLQDFELLICDDSADDGETTAYARSICLRFFDESRFRIWTNPTNQGSDLSFAKLTQVAQGTYIAYADQDDIFADDKLECLAPLLEDAVLAYSNIVLIDGDGRLISPSIHRKKKRYVAFSGRDLYRQLLYRNFITGCGMIIRADIAKASLPIVKGFVHDHWLALYASTQGAFAYCDKPLTQYRLHERNQIGLGTLSGVSDRPSYIQNRLLPERDRMQRADRKSTRLNSSHT